MIRHRRPGPHRRPGAAPVRRGVLAAVAPLLAATVLLLPAEPAGAADVAAPAATDESGDSRGPRLYLGGGIGYSRATVRQFRLDGSYTAAGHGFNDGVLRAGYHLDPHWALELSYQSWDEDGGPYKQIDVRLVTAGVVWYSDGPFARLELAIGHVETVIGVDDLSSPDPPRQIVALPGEEDLPGFAAGVGYRFFLARSLTLTLEVEGAWLPRQDNRNILYGTVNAVLGYFVW